MLLSKEVKVNWDLYKGNVNSDKQKNAYIRFSNNMSDIGAKLLTDYEGYEQKVWISIEGVEFYITPHKFNDRTYKTVNRFKNNLSKNGDKFIRYVKYVENTGLTATIKTFDGMEVDINIGSYDNFCKSRKDTVSMANEIGLKVKSYIGNREKAIFYNEHFSFEMRPNGFKVQMYKSAIKFINSLEYDDKFIEFVGFVDNKCLVAKIKNKFNTYQEIPTAAYKLFNEGRSRLYEYCEENNYKVLSPYLGNTENILIDIDCEHGEFWTTPRSIIKTKFKCPKCVTFKGENNPMWNPNITEEERENGRFIKGYNDFIKDVYKRDNYTCQCCGAIGTGRNLNAHHLDGYNWCKDKRTDVNNGITLCEDCHKDFHRMYGKGHNTKEQFEEWIKNKNREELESAS